MDQRTLDQQAATRSVGVKAVARDGVAGPLAALVESFNSRPEKRAVLQIHGSTTEWSLPVQQALYHAAFEALWSWERGARATIVILGISFSDDALRMEVRDDGVSRSQRTVGKLPGVHYGLSQIRKVAAQVGAKVEAGPLNPRGMYLLMYVTKSRASGLQERSVTKKTSHDF